MKLKQLITISLTCLSLLFGIIFLFNASPSVYAASNTYTYCTYYSATKDMNIPKFYEEFSTFIFFENGKSPSITWYSTVEESDTGQLHFTGQYPDGGNISTYSFKKEITSEVGSYIIAETSNYDNGVIYIDYDSLKEGKTVNDVCKEAFKQRHTNVKDPSFDYEKELYHRYTTLSNLYGYTSTIHELTWITGAREAKTTNFRVIMFSSYSLLNSTSGEAIANGYTPSTEDVTPPKDDESNSAEDDNKDDNELPNDSNNPGSNTDTDETPSQEEQDADLAFKVILGVSGGVLGLTLIICLISFVKWVIRWLKG